MGGPSRTRLSICWATVAATVPYLTIKVLWLGGSQLGMVDPDQLDTPTYRAANAVTLVLDAAVVVLALALAYDWGRRLPAWCLLPPMWVATGLLAPVVLLLPLAAPVAGGQDPGAGSDALAGWVYAVVYAGFLVQGLLIAVAFVLYARDRWPAALDRPAADGRGRPTRAVQRFVAGVLAGLAAGTAGLNLAWAVGGTAGLGDLAGRQTQVDRVTLGVYAVFAAAAALGLPALVTGRPARWPAWAAPTLVWLGSGAMVTWGLYLLVIATNDPSLTSPGMNLAVAVKVMVGAAAAVLGIVAAAERVETRSAADRGSYRATALR